jgi:hypothetical protein
VARLCGWRGIALAILAISADVYLYFARCRADYFPAELPDSVRSWCMWSYTGMIVTILVCAIAWSVVMNAITSRRRSGG